MISENTSQTALFATLSTTMSLQHMQSVRELLKTRVGESLGDGHEFELQVMKVSASPKSIVSWISKAGKGLPVIIIDEAHPHPRSATWLADMKESLGDLKSGEWPRLIYVTGQPDVRGALEADDNPLIHEYLGCRDNAQLIRTMTAAVIRLLANGKVSAAQADPGTESCGVTGQSAAIREAATELAHVLRAPCGLVTGPVGTGKNHLIRTLWSRLRCELVDPKRYDGRLVVLSCGSLFKEFSFGGDGRLCVATRDVIEQTCFKSHLDEAQNGLLVLHHVEQLPWAAQHELADVLEKAAVNAKRPIHLEFMMEDGSYLADVRIVGTSELSPAELAQSKRIAPDLLRRLGKYHAAIPSLDQRKEDIPALAADILRRIALRTQMKAPPVLDKYAVALLEDTDWPHNISDLVRVLERAMVKCRKGTALTADVLREATGEYFQWTKSPKTWADQVAAFERKMILNETVLAGRTVEQAAKELKKNPKWLYRKIKDLGLDGEVGVRPSKVRKKIPLKKNGGYDPGADR